MQSTVTENDRVLHLYAHIPFCPAKCSYCAFVTHVGSVKLMEPYLHALKSEIGSLQGEAGPLRSVYFGGGTPSMMSARQTEGVLNAVDDRFGLAPGCEVTLEGHPDTVGPEKLAGFRAAGVTRVSFGGESLSEGELLALGRTHSPRRLAEVVDWSRAARFDSVALDFMYGLPGQTLQSWKATLHKAVALEVDHLSLYPLSVEPRTVFARRRREGKLALPPDESVEQMYHLACDILRNSGYIHYEVSNWARPGHQCVHNTAYWLNREFFGIGVGAHGYVHPYRTENIAGTARYIERMQSGTSPRAGREPIDGHTRLQETVMLRLRLLEEGLDIDQVRREFNVDLDTVKATEIGDLLQGGLIERHGRRLVLPERRALIGNEVYSLLM